MKINRNIIFFIAAISSVASADQSLCVSEKSVGFVYENNDWIETKLKPNGKFIVSLDGRKVSVKKIGKNRHFYCDDYVLSNIITCEIPEHTVFKYYPRESKFSFTNLYGFFYLGEEGLGFTEIGSCTDF